MSQPNKLGNASPSWGRRVRALRSRHQWTRSKMAEMTPGVSADAINRIERGDVGKPRGGKQEALAEAFGVTVGYLLTGKPHHPDDPEFDVLDDLTGFGRSMSPGSDEATIADPNVPSDSQSAKQALDKTQSIMSDIDTLVFNNALSTEQKSKIFGIIYSCLHDLLSRRGKGSASE